MIRALFPILVTAAAISSPAVAEIYKWVDENGKTHYSDKPLTKRPVTTVNATPQGFGTSERKSCVDPQCRLETLRALRSQDPIAIAPVTQAPTGAQTLDRGAPSSRGLEFATFIQLSRGMTEGEILARAGIPDIQNFEGTQQLSRHIHRGAAGRSATTTHVVKTYTYLPTASDPFTTVLTFSGGRVADIQRIRQF
jgi:hypothetical protein